MQFVKELFEEKVLLIKHFQMSNEKKSYCRKRLDCIRLIKS